MSIKLNVNRVHGALMRILSDYLQRISPQANHEVTLFTPLAEDYRGYVLCPTSIMASTQPHGWVLKGSLGKNIKLGKSAQDQFEVFGVAHTLEAETFRGSIYTGRSAEIGVLAPTNQAVVWSSGFEAVIELIDHQSNKNIIKQTITNITEGSC